MDRDTRGPGGGGDADVDRNVTGAPNGVRSRVVQRYGTLAHAIQRKQGDDADRAPTIHDAATAAVENRGSGATVDAGVAQRVGDYLGANLSGVRVHSDPLSQEATAAMGARAFAYGSDVFLGHGERSDDLGLMAHELTHVVQQGAAGQRALQRQVQVGAADSPAERQADAVSAAVTAGQPGAAAAGALIVDDPPLQPGQMLKSQFLDQLHAQVMATARDELGPIWSITGCPYIEQYFGRYSNQPAAAGEALLKRFAPGAASARTAADMIPPVIARVREGVRNWRETGQPPADVAAVDPRAAAGATSVPPRVQEQQIQQGASGGIPAAPAAQTKLAEPGSPAALVATLGAGERLDPGTASRMEDAFGQSFADVRIHTDATAARLTDQHDARAFTIGSHVAFGANAYRPGVPEGDALVAHELAHVIQQQGAGPAEAVVQRKSIEDGGAEAHADEATRGVVASLWGGVKGAARSIKDTLKTDVGMKRCSKTGSNTSAPMPTGSLTASGSVAHTTGAQLDTYVSSSTAISVYVRSSIAAGVVATGHVHFFNNADFRRVCIAYLLRFPNPNTGSMFTQTEAEAFEPTVNAYQDGPDLYVAQDRGTPSTVIHEGMHLYENTAYKQLGFNVHEGTTEWLTRIVISEQSLGFVRSNYQPQYTSATKMAAKAGQAAVMAAYFQGNVAGLRAAIDAATSAGTFDRWKTYVNAGNYTAADALM